MNIKAAFLIVMLSVGAFTAFAIRSRMDEPAPRCQLKELEGSIDHNRTTLDPVKSDLAVRAAKALRDGDTAAAEELYRKAVSLYPADSGTHSDLGACLFVQGRYDEAWAEYGRAFELDPRSADAHYGLGCIDYKKGQYAETLAYLTTAAELRDAHAGTHRVLGLVYEQLRQPAKARSHYERAVQIDPAVAQEPYIRRRLSESDP